MQDQSLDCEKCVWLCTDQAASMAAWQHGRLSFDCIRKNKKVANKNLLSTHCMYRCEYVAFQKLSPELNDIMIRPV